jgi:hypothetical protein
LEATGSGSFGSRWNQEGGTEGPAGVLGGYWCVPPKPGPGLSLKPNRVGQLVDTGGPKPGRKLTLDYFLSPSRLDLFPPGVVAKF